MDNNSNQPPAVALADLAVTVGSPFCFKSMKDSSTRYGPCEVCGNPASDVWIKIQVRGHSVFGHKECL